MSLALKVGIVVLGLVFYFFSISTLISQRRDKAQQQVLFDSMDNNGDGIITRQQINGFRPCPESNRSKLVARLNSIGPSVTFDQFQQDVNKNMIKYAIAPCAVDAHLFSNPAEISKRTHANTVEPFFALYDLNKDGYVRYNEYQLVNKFHGRSIKGSTQTFVFMDADNDWQLSRTEIEKAKLTNLDPKLPSSLRRKPTPRRHGHHASAPAAATTTAPTTDRAQASQQRVDTRYEQPIQRQNYYDTQRDTYARQPNYQAGPGEFDIIYDSRLSASERIERERRQANEFARRERADYYREPQRQRVYTERAYNDRAYERPPVRDEYARPQQPRPTERMEATGRLDSLSTPRAREPTYRNYEHGL